MTNNAERLGLKIKELRISKGYTQAELAEIIDRSKNHISKIELGQANPPISLVFDIAKALNTHPFELFMFDIPKPDFDYIKELSNSDSQNHRKAINSLIALALKRL